MGLNTAGKNAALDGWGDLITHASLHTADPGDAGANEVTTAGSVYARQSFAPPAASSGTITFSSFPQWGVPSGTTVTHVGYWSAVTGGTFYGSDTTTNQTYTADGFYKLTAASYTIA